MIWIGRIIKANFCSTENLQGLWILYLQIETQLKAYNHPFLCWKFCSIDNMSVLMWDVLRLYSVKFFLESKEANLACEKFFSKSGIIVTEGYDILEILLVLCVSPTCFSFHSDMLFPNMQSKTAVIDNKTKNLNCFWTAMVPKCSSSHTSTLDYQFPVGKAACFYVCTMGG